MGEAQEETLAVVCFVLQTAGGRGMVGVVELGEQCGGDVEPWEPEVRAQWVAVSDHVLVLEVPGIFVRHPFRVGEDVADLAPLLRDCRFVAAELLEAYNVVCYEVEWCVRVESLDDGGGVVINESFQLFIASSLSYIVRNTKTNTRARDAYLCECRAVLVWYGGVEFAFFRDLNQFDMLREGFCKSTSSVLCP